jgi:F0F1-type ATP synthase membrane subunit b/b'
MKDISNRTNNILLQVLSVLIILFITPFWIFIYLLIRPSNTLFEKYYQEIEENLDIFHKIIEEKIEKKGGKCPDIISDNEIIKK